MLSRLRPTSTPALRAGFTLQASRFAVGSCMQRLPCMFTSNFSTDSDSTSKKQPATAQGLLYPDNVDAPYGYRKLKVCRYTTALRRRKLLTPHTSWQVKSRSSLEAHAVSVSLSQTVQWRKVPMVSGM